MRTWSCSSLTCRAEMLPRSSRGAGISGHEACVSCGSTFCLEVWLCPLRLLEWSLRGGLTWGKRFDLWTLACVGAAIRLSMSLELISGGWGSWSSIHCGAFVVLAPKRNVWRGTSRGESRPECPAIRSASRAVLAARLRIDMGSNCMAGSPISSPCGRSGQVLHP